MPKPAAVRAAQPHDIPAIAALVLADAARRERANSALWPMAVDARRTVEAAIADALAGARPGVREAWLVAEAGGRLAGTVHTLRLPVPPIYAGAWGDPGLIMPECLATADAPEGTLDALVAAAEADLREAGARLLLATRIDGNRTGPCLAARHYAPLTLYLAKDDFAMATPAPVRAAEARDIAGIVRLSAIHRARLAAIDAFWTPHPEADARFASWMEKSRTLADRDMLVAGPAGALDGYAIAQPASRLHFPPAHALAGIGVIDDFFHRDFADLDRLDADARGATALLRAAEGAFAARGTAAAIVVCPAGWGAKVRVLEGAGYRTAITWLIKR
ncbi:hypothetical protein [Acuticoccus kandeliae]|uniref:hypothetical protein n=1 Tax=Acuticoccus kandeliae TaxID=2073160 RepID=UPI000D3E488C|nr:hypothetical protein [Acuticoccus kandeliae]